VGSCPWPGYLQEWNGSLFGERHCQPGTDMGDQAERAGGAGKGRACRQGAREGGAAGGRACCQGTGEGGTKDEERRQREAAKQLKKRKRGEEKQLTEERKQRAPHPAAASFPP
jgi:hypothetical protein